MKVAVRVQGLDAILRKLQGDGREVYAVPWRRALTDSTRLVYGEAQRRAGAFRRSGALQASLTQYVDDKPVPYWGRVSTNRTRVSQAYPRGFRYPWALEASRKFGHKGWLSGALKTRRKRIENLLSAACREIERLWGGG